MTPIFSMKPLVSKVFGLLSVLVVSNAAVAVDLQTLIDRSPFAPPGQSAETAAPVAQGTLEFRGVVTDKEGTAYNIFDASTNKGSWVRADDENSPIKVRGYDAANGQLEVEQNGRPVTLTLKRATIQAGQPVAAMGNVPAPNNPNPAGPAQVQRNGNGSADARRLEAVAAEVRRRRALRNASRTAPQGQPPANQTPPPAPAPAP